MTACPHCRGTGLTLTRLCLGSYHALEVRCAHCYDHRTDCLWCRGTGEMTEHECERYYTVAERVLRIARDDREGNGG